MHTHMYTHMHACMWQAHYHTHANMHMHTLFWSLRFPLSLTHAHTHHYSWKSENCAYTNTMRKKLYMHKQPLQTPTLKQLRMKTVHTLVYIPTVKKTCAYANTLITQHTPTIKKKQRVADANSRWGFSADGRKTCVRCLFWYFLERKAAHRYDVWHESFPYVTWRVC